MKVFLVMYGGVLSNGGGAERRFIRAWEHFKKYGQENIILITNENLFNSAKVLGLLKDNRQAMIYKDTNRKSDPFRFSKYVIDIIKDNKNNIVHLVLLQRSLVLLYLFLLLRRKIYSTKVVTTVASYLYAYNIGLKASEKMNYRLIMWGTDVVDSLYSGIKLKHKKVKITPCSFTDYEKYESSEKENIISFVGRLMPEKNPTMFVEAINEIVNNMRLEVANRWKFCIMGGGVLENKLRQYVSENNLEEYIFWEKGDSSELLKKSKVFVSLQGIENYPSQSILESIASKNMIIAIDVGDTKRIVNPDYQILIKNDKKDLVAAIVSIMENKIDMSRNRDSALEDLKKNHNVDIFCEYLNGLWNSEK